MIVSVILPTYNEKENIELFIPKINKILDEYNYRKEILVIDDSSPDGTADVVKKLQNKYKDLRLIVRQKREGLGAALRQAYDSANGDIIVSIDSDMSFDENYIIKLIKKIEAGYDMVTGSRHGVQGYYEKKYFKTNVKNLFSKFGNIIIRKTFNVSITDFTANCRAIRKEVWHSLKTEENTNAMLVEMILKSKIKGYKITEIPVVFKDRKYGKSKIVLSKEVPILLIILIKIKIREILGKI